MSLPKLPQFLEQNLLSGKGQYSHLNTDKATIITRDESEISVGVLKPFLNDGKPLGVSVAFDENDQTIIWLAISDSCNHVLLISFPTLLGRRPDSLFEKADRVRSMLENVLCRGFYAFDLAPLALSLYRDLGIRITLGVDIQSAVLDKNGRRKSPVNALSDLIGSENASVQLHRRNVESAFADLTCSRSNLKTSFSVIIASRAWVSQFISEFENAPEQFSTVPIVDTLKVPVKILDIVSKWAGDALRLHHMKPMETEHAVTGGTDGEGNFQATSHVYKAKLHSNQQIQLSLANEHGSIKLPASTGFVKGRAAPLKISHAIGSSNAILTGSIISRGRDGPTTADSRKADIVLDILKGKMSLFTENPWIINLWDPPHGVMSWPARSTPHYFKSESVTVPETGPKRPLNHSQTLAIEKMLSPKDEDRIILIRGPPGSGKTSVISRFVEIAYSRDCPGIWLIAQSNVAVKNIAEKLASIGFMNWRLLISVDFHLDWHEHLYGHDIKDNIIRSDDFYTMLPTRIAGCKVILCTLSMLSSQWIRKKFLPSIPIHTLIVDEASQIEIGDYLPVFTLAVTKLEKMCLIGDDKQLPPHGQEDIEELQSVFEINHLHAYVHLLDTQYRMPPQMGDFISEQVYESLLKSNALHPITNSTIACQFLDIPGTEKMQNNSFINNEEASAVLKLAAFLESSGKSYRVVTPYDSQRNLIEKLMQQNELNWNDKCFNVDSFQGNEDDYIIISIVRSLKPGFLNNLRRTNVMLTRFKRGMFIFTNKKFVNSKGAETLVGKLAMYFEEKVGDKAWLNIKDVEEGKVVLK